MHAESAFLPIDGCCSQLVYQPADGSNLDWWSWWIDSSSIVFRTDKNKNANKIFKMSKVAWIESNNYAVLKWKKCRLHLQAIKALFPLNFEHFINCKWGYTMKVLRKLSMGKYIWSGFGLLCAIFADLLRRFSVIPTKSDLPFQFLE